MADREKFFKCDCHSEGILITKFDDEEEMYFSYWRNGINPIKLSFWMRLRLCYLALFKGSYYDDQVILNRQKAIELASWLILETGVLNKMDKTKFEVGDSHGNWENEGGGNLSSLPDEGCEGGHY